MVACTPRLLDVLKDVQSQAAPEEERRQTFGRRSGRASGAHSSPSFTKGLLHLEGNAFGAPPLYPFFKHGACRHSLQTILPSTV